MLILFASLILKSLPYKHLHEHISLALTLSTSFVPALIGTHRTCCRKE